LVFSYLWRREAHSGRAHGDWQAICCWWRGWGWCSLPRLCKCAVHGSSPPELLYAFSGVLSRVPHSDSTRHLPTSPL